MPELHRAIDDVTRRIKKRSESTRASYLQRLEDAAGRGPNRLALSCTNIAHAVAASPADDKIMLYAEKAPNLGIVSAYNDMLSAHQPYHDYPERIKSAARAIGATAQFAGGTPAMCDGVTQGQPGMELSLFSRDVIALSTAISLSHNMFDAAVCLGICDKIVPGLMMGSLAFGHLPVVFIPAGPMTSGLPNKEKAAVRQRYAEGKATRAELLESEAASYHGPGTCTFYGTANSNQMMMEFMGLHLPGAAFINPGMPLRDAMTEAAAQRALELTARGNAYTPIGRIVDEKAIVNGIAGLMATGGSTNHTLHIIAIARVAGIMLDWSDFAAIGKAVPLLAQVYPNGSADVNHFHAAGGLALVARELLGAGLLHDDVLTVAGQGLEAYTQEPWLNDGKLEWRPGPTESANQEVVSSMDQPFQADGGLQLLEGNLGRAIIKVSAVAPQHRRVEAPARVFSTQLALQEAFKAGELERDMVAVVRWQGPRANGMPELHKLTPALGVLQDRGFKVALVTDGRMSGASGKVPAAIHVTPESLDDGPLARVRDGDMILLDAEAGILEVKLSDAELAGRSFEVPELSDNTFGMGRELFAGMRDTVCPAEQGAATVFGTGALV